jgi:hypothetical protein
MPLDDIFVQKNGHVTIFGGHGPSSAVASDHIRTAASWFRIQGWGYMVRV